MPADRTKGSNRRGVQLTWTIPVDSSTAKGFAFAPNVTPVTFNDPPPSLEICTGANLFPPPSDCSSSRRPAHSKKKPDNHIPRPPNAFILFRSSFIKSQHVSTEVETNHSTLSKIIGLTWQNLPHDERQVWHAKAKAALEEHKRKFPQYAFRPLHPKGKPTEKRKVREVGPKDLTRCAKIAELLVKGKKGHELDAAVQEFDRHHVPEVVTRFEAPITARMYRRSSSAPALDTDLPRDSSSPSSPLSRPQVRSASLLPSRQPSPCPSAEGTFADQDPEAEAFYDAPFSPALTPPELYSFPPTPDPSYDFPAFSYGHNMTAPMYSDTPISEHNALGVFDMQPRALQRNLSSLSIDTTTSVDEWSTSSSPTPSSPSSYSPCDSPSSQDAFAAIAGLDQFDIELNTHSIPELQLYSGDVYCPPSPDLTSTFDYRHLSKDPFSLFEQPSIHHSDADFTAFLASIPPYDSM